MAHVLILGSHVASSRVGGGLANLALALSPYEIEPIFVPTTLMGRHPGWGPPGGGGVPDALFDGMLEGIAANGLFARIDAVMTNYFASPAQIKGAGRSIDAIKAANPKAIIVVDPVMGDAPGGLYVSEANAAALSNELVPRGDYLTPNLWELGYLTGLPTNTLPEIAFAAATLGRPTLVTSVRTHDGLGGLLVDGHAAWLGVHREAKIVPKGTGDLFAALFLGFVVQGLSPSIAMAKALAGVNGVVEVADRWGTSDLPIVAAAGVAWDSPELVLEKIS
jgi:pyridoxine kinase